MGVFNNFNYSFDNSRFGSLINLNSDQSNTINLVSNTTNFAPWQISDLANGSIVKTNYFQNPTFGFCTSMANNLIIITAAAVNIANVNSADSGSGFPLNADLANAANALALSANNCLLEVSKFGSHTNNVSGVSANIGSYTVPTYDLIIGSGTQLTMLLNKTDGIANAVSTLGCMTSLFINDILTANTITIANNANVINIADTLGNATSNMCFNIANYLSNVQSILYNTRSQDWFFYSTSMTTLQNYMFLNGFSAMGNTKTGLINNVIGTPSLIAKISANTANSAANTS
jgi:hypothetical protein